MSNFDLNNFQRVGAAHNAGVGSAFESVARNFFAEKEGIRLTPKFEITLGVSANKKIHSFDLGSNDPSILVECKSHTWTQGKKSPSAKLTVWNESMYYFHLTPARFRKIMFVLKHLRSAESLAEHYIRRFEHLIPDGVELWEFDETTHSGVRLR
jgi:hypothetical protein